MSTFESFVNRLVVEYYNKDLKCIGVDLWPREECFPRFFKKFLCETSEVFMLMCEKYGCRQFITPLNYE